MPAFRERYGYDALGRLVAVERPDGAVRYTWDARGHRIKIEPLPACPNCGKSVSPDSAVCSNCGSSLHP